jgi:phosphorylcholine metabolism protein LicD
MAKFKPKKNKYVLSGQNGIDALKMLNDVTDILDKYNVKYWLDFGTLLGIVRENRILPWDDDMDISIFEQDFEIMRTKVMPEIKAMRYRDYLRYFNSSIGPFKEGMPRSFKVRTNRLFFFKGYVKLDIFIMYKNDQKYNWLELGELHSLPENLLKEFDYFDFNGKKYRVPKDYDKYLTYHYGDWRVPNENYNSSIDNKRTLAKDYE